MNNSILNHLMNDAREIRKTLIVSENDALRLAIEINKLQALSEIAYFLRQDGEFQESMSNIAEAINNKI